MKRRSVLVIALLGWALFAMTQVASAQGQWVVPNEPDLMIRTRQSIDSARSAVITTTMFLKGPRQRSERLWEYSASNGNQGHSLSITISQCDLERLIQANPETRLYAIEPLPDPAAAAARRQKFLEDARKHAVPQPSVPDVVVTIDGVDTGERRQVSGREARHIVTAMTTTPSAGASTHQSTRIEDGWYIDLPRADCLEPNPTTATAIGGFTQVARPGQPLDHLRVEHHGIVASGFAVENMSRYSEPDDGIATTETTTMVEVSEGTLAPDLFEVPTGYQPALPRIAGGFDLTKTDTLGNRLAEYWNYAISWSASLISGWRIR